MTLAEKQEEMRERNRNSYTPLVIPLEVQEKLTAIAEAKKRPEPESDSPKEVDYSDVLSQIFTEFAKRRKKDKIIAWMWLQDALASNAHKICPDVMSIKDLIAAQANIEEMLKGAGGTQGESASEYLAKWLSGDDAKVIQ